MDTKYRNKRNKPQVAELQRGVGSMRGATCRGQRTGAPSHAGKALVTRAPVLLRGAQALSKDEGGTA